MGTYLRDHWCGRHSLPRTFWVNFLIPFVLIAMIESWLRPPAMSSGSMQGTVVGAYVLIAHGMILPWQIVGLWRSSRRHLKERGDLMVVTVTQLAALIALVTAAGVAATTVQRIAGWGMRPTESSVDALPRYKLQRVAGNASSGSVASKTRAIVIDGAFETGLSRDLRNLLTKSPDIETIILNSAGGRVFEARGVAKQIVDHGLKTHVEEVCRSACTIAFMAGAVRTLGENGQLGFHSYRLDGVAPFVEPEDEQAKDKVFFLQQGLAPDFVRQVFEVAPEDMWHPETDRLLNAGAVHGIAPRSREVDGQPDVYRGQ